MSRSLDRISLLETFIRIAEAGSLSAAARDLGLSQPTVSRQLVELESRMRTQLLRRTTHSMALTEAGVELLADARQILDDWGALAEKHLSSETMIEGRLKVVAPVALGQTHLARLACEFQARYPGVLLTWMLDDDTIRFAEVGCDCWIKVGPIPDERLVVKRIGSVERLLVGSSEFVAEHGVPGTPNRARQLPLVSLDPFEGSRLPLRRGRRSATIEPTLRMRTNNIFALKEAAIMGIGMAVLPEWFIADELQTGELQDLVPRWKAPSLDIHVAYLPSRHQPARLRAFLEAISKGVSEIVGISSV